MKKQKSGVGTLSAIGGGFIGLAITSFDTVFGKVMLALGLIILILTIIRIVK